MGKQLLILSVFLMVILSLAQMAVTLGAQAQVSNMLEDTRKPLHELTDCAQPCLLGIGMGIQQEEALRILKSNQWVGTISTQSFETRQGPSTLVEWDWSGAQPASIDASEQGLLITERFPGNFDEEVTGIEIHTTLRFPDVHRILGEADGGTLNVWNGPGSHIQYVAAYYDADTVTLLTAGADMLCPFTWMRYWNTFAALNLSSHVGRGVYVPPEQLPAVC